LAVKSGRIPDRWIPAKWTWLQKACRLFRGAPRQIYYNIQFIESAETVDSIVAQNSLGQPQVESNGLAVWILTSQKLKRSPGASTDRDLRATLGEGIRADLLIGAATNMLRAECFARLEKETIDLSTRLTVYSRAQTKFVVAMRAQIPYGKALFVVDSRHPELVTNRTAIWIKADEVDAKGNIVQRPQLPHR